MNKLLVISIIILIVGSASAYFFIGQKTNSCNSYCERQGFVEGKCLNCAYLTGANLPSECNSSSFFSDKETYQICMLRGRSQIPYFESQIKDNTRHGCLCN